MIDLSKARLSDEKIVKARCYAYAKEGIAITDICRYANLEDRGIADAQLKACEEEAERQCRQEKNELTFQLGAVANKACQQRVERIFREMEEHINFDNSSTGFYRWWQALKKQEGVK